LGKARWGEKRKHQRLLVGANKKGNGWSASAKVKGTELGDWAKNRKKEKLGQIPKKERT